MSGKEIIRQFRKSSALPRHASGDPVAARIANDYETTLAQGRAAVESNVHLKTLTDLVAALKTKLEPIEASIAELRARRDLEMRKLGADRVAGDQARQLGVAGDAVSRVFEDQLSDLYAEREKVVSEVLAAYAEAEESFLSGYPDPGRQPRPLTTSGDDVRVLSELSRFRDLGPAARIEALDAAIRREDRATVHFLTPMAAESLRHPSIAEVPEDTRYRLDATVQLAKKYLACGPDGWRKPAHLEALKRAAHLRARAETAATTVLEEGLAGLDRLENMKRGDGEPGGALSLASPPDPMEEGPQPGAEGPTTLQDYLGAGS